MDLALEFGMTLDTLNSVMTEDELTQWVLYSRQRMLPTRRIEYHLARVAQVIAQAFAGSKAPLSDFLVEIVRKDDAKESDDAGPIGALASGRNVYRLGQGRKVKEPI